MLLGLAVHTLMLEESSQYVLGLAVDTLMLEESSQYAAWTSSRHVDARGEFTICRSDQQSTR